MNKKQVIKEGLLFTGMCTDDKEEAKAEAAKIRKLGFKSKIFIVQANSNTKWSVYACEKYFADKNIKTLTSRLELISSTFKKIQTIYKEAANDFKKEKTRIQRELKKNKIILGAIFDKDKD